MGWGTTDDDNKFIEPAGMRDTWTTEEMLFATDWNWLMPVVAKLQNEVESTFSPRAGNIVLTFGMVVNKILSHEHGINVIFNGVCEADEMFSNCCGASTPDTDYDICPDCKEHCEFIQLES